MASTCISSCINDARVPIRATYVNLYKWPESDAEFVKTVGSSASSNVRRGGQARVVDSISCRQMYLRSYTFSRKESVPEKTKKCLGRVRERVQVVHRKKRIRSGGGGGGGGGGVCLRLRKCVVLRKAKEASYAALFSVFRRLLSCTTKVDVVDHTDF